MHLDSLLTLAALDPLDDPTWKTVVAMALTGMVGAATFLLKRAFTGIENGQAILAAKLDTLAAQRNSDGVAIALLQQSVSELKAETAANRQRLHDLKDNWSPTLARAVMMEERLARCEKHISELSEGVVR